MHTGLRVGSKRQNVHLSPPLLSMEVNAVALWSLMKHELLDVARGAISVPHEVRWTKEALIDYLVANNTPIFAAQALAIAGLRDERKRRLEEEHKTRRVTQQMAEEAEAARDTGAYLGLPTDAERMECNRAFYEATLNAALEMGVCGVCAREVGVHSEGLEEPLLSELLHREHLRPAVPHGAHDLYDDCLLHPNGVTVEEGRPVLVKSCKSCCDNLGKDGDRGPQNLHWQMTFGLALCRRNWWS